MRPTRIFSTSAFLLLIFLIQESIVSRINFPIAGFSLYLLVLLGMISLEDRSGAVILGFIGGILLDLSPTIDSPFGQWALVLTIVGFGFSLNRESMGDFSARPAAFVGIIALGAFVGMTLFLGTSALLGESNGSFAQSLRIILGNTFWTLIFAPLILPLLAKFRNVSLHSRERI